jgi:anthranilate synthase component 2
MAKILVFDNYDSFTYNLVQYVQRSGNHKVDIFLNDEIPLDDMEQYDGIIISPGPGLPKDAELMLPMIRRYKSSKRIFGVCLGQQAIAEAFGGSTVFHGVATDIIPSLPKHYLFEGFPDTFKGGRYHSWVVEKETLPACLKIEAVDEDGQIMALSHNEFDICSVQFILSRF